MIRIAGTVLAAFSLIAAAQLGNAKSIRNGGVPGPQVPALLGPVAPPVAAAVAEHLGLRHQALW